MLGQYKFDIRFEYKHSIIIIIMKLPRMGTLLAADLEVLLNSLDTPSSKYWYSSKKQNQLNGDEGVAALTRNS